VCKGKFVSENSDNQGFFCPLCKTRPTRYFISGRAFGIGEVYTDPKTHKVIETYSHALDVLVAINRDSEEKGEKRFNPNDWIPARAAERRIENITKTWLKNHEAEAEKGIKTKSWFQQKKYICENYIAEFFEGMDIDAVNQDDVEAFYHSLLNRKLSSKYIRQILNILKGLFLRYRAANVPNFPDFTVIPVKEKQRLGLAREVSIMEKIPERHGYRLAILTLIRTGMRINEVIALKVHNLIDGIAWVDKAMSSDGELRLARKAGGTVPYRLTPELWKLIVAHITGKESDAYAFEINSKPITTGRLYKVWKRACSDAGVKSISLQQASRHSTATAIKEWHDKQACVEIAERLGHLNLTTQKYYIVRSESA